MQKIIIGARGSKLSRVQVREVLGELKRYHPEVDFSCVWVETTGDKDLKTSLRTLEKSDFFTREVDQMQLQGRCRISIHSAKDVPEPLPHGLVLVALTRGVDPSDALVMRAGESLAHVKRVGTSCARRENNVKALKAGVTCVDIRGTIERRLSFLDTRELDGVVVAEAALIRLNLMHLNRLPLPGETAPLQGKLAVLARTDDAEMKNLFSCIHTKA